MPLLLSVAFLAAGCLDDQAGAGQPTATDAPFRTAESTLPDRMHWTGQFTVGVGAGAATGNPCTLASCDLRDFTLDGTHDLEATLTWGLPANDFDLYLYQGETELASAGSLQPGDAPGMSETLVYQDLPPGDYRFMVVGSTMVMDSYELDAVFS